MYNIKQRLNNLRHGDNWSLLLGKSWLNSCINFKFQKQSHGKQLMIVQVNVLSFIRYVIYLVRLYIFVYYYKSSWCCLNFTHNKIFHYIPDLYVYILFYVCMYACMCVCMYVCMYVWMYVCVYMCVCEFLNVWKCAIGITGYDLRTVYMDHTCMDWTITIYTAFLLLSSYFPLTCFCIFLLHFLLFLPIPSLLIFLSLLTTYSLFSFIYLYIFLLHFFVVSSYFFSTYHFITINHLTLWFLFI